MEEMVEMFLPFPVFFLYFCIGRIEKLILYVSLIKQIEIYNKDERKKRAWIIVVRK